MNERDSYEVIEKLENIRSGLYGIDFALERIADALEKQNTSELKIDSTAIAAQAKKE